MAKLGVNIDHVATFVKPDVPTNPIPFGQQPSQNWAEPIVSPCIYAKTDDTSWTAMCAWPAKPSR